MAKTTTPKNNDYDVIKYFKELYSKLSSFNIITFIGDGRKAILDSDNKFVISVIKLKEEDNKFIEWVNGKKVSILISDLSELKNILKKNLKSITVSDDALIISYVTKDGEDREITFRNNTAIETKYNQFSIIEKDIEILSNKEKIDKTDVEDKLIWKKNNVKIIEVPVKYLADFNGTSSYISYTDILKNKYRYTMIETISEKFEFKQIFYTI